MLVIARILLTVAALQYGLIPILVDLSPSHVFHSDWPPHSRFHMVWLLTSSAGLAVFVTWLVWRPGKQSNQRLRLACMPGFIVLGGFFVSAMLRQSYGGALADPAHQIMIAGIDGNLFSFSIAMFLQVSGTALVFAGCLGKTSVI